jgi:transcriptional regulator of arginine metabolism
VEAGREPHAQRARGNGVDAAMTDARIRRQKLIADLIRSRPVASQEEVTESLGQLGLIVTQATVSRDLDQLGAIKVKRGGVLSYALPDQMGASDWGLGRLDRILSEWVQSLEAAGNMIVARTPPGSAHLVAAAIDQAKLPEIAGTVSGDDTVLLIVRDGFNVARAAADIGARSGQSSQE